MLSIMNIKKALDWTDDEFTARMLTFFTNVDLAMIRDEMSEELRRVRGRKGT